MKSRFATLILVVTCAGCATTSPLGPGDVQSFPLGESATEVDHLELVTRAPAQQSASSVASMRQRHGLPMGVALDPMVLQDGGGDQLDLEDRVVKLEGEMVEAQNPGHSIAFVFAAGQAEYDDDLDPVDEPTAYQVDVLLGPSGGLGMEFTGAYAYEKDSGVKVHHATAAVGFRYTLGRRWIQPYIGGGYEIEYAKLDTGNDFPSFDDHSWEHGPYIRGGINLSLGAARRWFVGADVRYGLIGGEYDFGDGFKPDADYMRYLAFLGFRF